MSKSNIAFFHPDLGVGGGERVIILSALELQNRGHKVTIFTSMHDPRHCFPETRDGRLKVEVHGSWMPKSIFGRFFIFCTILRMMFLWLRVWMSGRKFDVIINDQLSAINPLLTLLCKKLLFYCHYPDLLLCEDRNHPIKRIYRYPFDILEEWTTGLCDTLMVNSKFTESVVRRTFPSLRNSKLKVLYPPVDLVENKQFEESIKEQEESKEYLLKQGLCIDEDKYFFSLNRFERKKNHHISVKSFYEFSKNSKKKYKLVVAGGYDARVRENVQYWNEIARICDGKLGDNVILLQTISSHTRLLLMKHATAVLYPPAEEHFGMIPCEAMALGTIVIASKCGGPLETIDNGKTGFLVECSVEGFSEGMKELINIPENTLKTISNNARKKIEQELDLKTFGNILEEEILIK
eukprot:GHVL01022138.1.p1 GENE.GHVL01022138.1~~GHVL01022138.1.p1  ORF type:complete len:408 (+),score=65.88 GHVL01022138.1:23-1246(+)